MPIAALAFGCAQGAPLDNGSGGTTAMTMPTMTTTTMTTSTSAPMTTTGETTDATTGETTTGSGTTTEALTSTTTEASTGTTGGEPTILGEYYPFGQVHSPITPDIAAAMTAIASNGARNDQVFAKVGGSHTASDNFLDCFADAGLVSGLPETLQPTVDWFNAQAAGLGATSFNRVSLAAMANWTADQVLAGMPNALTSEGTEIDPRFAVILFGTHELDLPQPDTLYNFAGNLLQIVDFAISVGTVPILSTIPNRTQPAGLEIHIPRYNGVIRAIAQGRKIPLIDLNLALEGLPNQGLAPDGVDLSVATGMDNAPDPCSFGLVAHGYNRRNLSTVEALARAKAAVVDGMPSDVTAPVLMGAGTLDEPIEIPGLPFVDMRSTADSPSDVIDSYAGACMAGGSTGPEYIYALTVDQSTKIRAMVFSSDEVDVDLHLMTLTDPNTCVKRGDRELEGPLQPGTYFLSIDTLGTPGEFAFVLVAE